MSRIAVKGPRELQKEVLNKGLCSACGACVNLCPYIEMVVGRAVMIEPCSLSEGKCYDFCPRTYIDVPSLDKHLFGACRSDLAMGSNMAIVKAKTTDSEIKSAAQYGGTTSALIAYALETGKIEAAVLTRSSDNINPKPAIARNRKEVLECAGSKYIVSPTIAKVLEAVKKETGKIGFVGTPCQVTALRKMQSSKSETGVDEIGLVIGLFCTWAFSPQAHQYIKGLAGSFKVVKFDVPPPPANLFVIETEEKRMKVPLDALRKFIMPSCNVCFDMTSEFADISVGTVEGEEDWNTVIVRTDLGKKFFKQAMEAGIIETRPLEKERLNHLYEASLNRKRKALKEMESLKAPYLIIRGEDRAKLLS